MPTASRKVIRLIAMLEAAKGALVLLAGFGIFELVHHKVRNWADTLVRHFHLDPASHYPKIFIEAATRLNDINLWLLAGAALAYASLRLFEAFGLWYQRRWAEWLGAVSGAIYIPIELYELTRSVSATKIGLLGVNVFCVVYLVQALRSRRAASR